MKENKFRQQFNNLKVKDKMKHAFGVMITMLMVSILVGCAGMGIVCGKLKTFYQNSYATVETVNVMYTDLQAAAKNLLQACLETADDQTTLRLSQAQEFFTEMEACVDSLEKTSFVGRKDLEVIQTDIDKVKEQFDTFSTNCKGDKTTEAFQIYNDTMLPYFSEIATTVEMVKQIETEKAHQMYVKGIRTVWISIAELFVVGVASVLIAIKIAKDISSALDRGIVELKDAAVKMSEGDFAIEIGYESKDELGELADAMRNMIHTTNTIISDMNMLLDAMSKGNFTVDTQIEQHYVGVYVQLKSAIEELKQRLSGTLQNINEASHQVNLGSEQLATNAQTLAEGATEQEQAVETLKGKIRTLHQMAVERADSAGNAAVKMENVAEEAVQGKQDIARLLEAMEQINDTSKEIEHIIVEIENIASQTNLLSLNASIEAARAGEAGKGFAVVADQIGKLASDSAQSAVNTRELISKSLGEVENGSSITQNTAQLLGEVLDAMAEIKDIARAANDTSITQAQMLGEVEKGIEQIASVVQVNTAAAEENSATSEELSAQSVTMNNMLEQFQLRND